MMRTILPAEKPADREVNVSCTSGSGLVTIEGSGPGIMWRRSFDPAEAVKLWRCLMGECSTVRATDADGIPVRLWSHVPPGSDDVWDLGNDGEWLCHLDADQALALAWALERHVRNALTTDAGKPAPATVWVLSAKVMLGGDCAGNGAEQIGGAERVFIDKETAFDNLREFLRPLVNEADRNPFHDVDGVLDSILGAASADETEWTYDGPDRSFRVTLYEREVEHGA